MAKIDGHLDEKVEGEGGSFEDAEVRNARAHACVCVLRDHPGEPGHLFGKDEGYVSQTQLVNLGKPAESQLRKMSKISMNVI